MPKKYVGTNHEVNYKTKEGKDGFMIVVAKNDAELKKKTQANKPKGSRIRSTRSTGRDVYENVDVKRDRELSQGTRHKINSDGEAICRTYGQGWVVPDVASRARSWNKVTCKSCLKKKPMKESFTLTESIKDEADQIELLLENCKATPYAPTLLVEAADKFIGHAIAALKGGKNPFETIPGSREILAGLMLLAKPTNRESLNMNQKKFDVISQFIDEKQQVKKYVANLAQQHGQSLVKALDAYVQEKDKREVLTKKLVQLQNAYSQVKQKVGQVAQEPIKKRIAV